MQHCTVLRRSKQSIVVTNKHHQKLDHKQLDATVEAQLTAQQTTRREVIRGRKRNGKEGKTGGGGVGGGGARCRGGGGEAIGGKQAYCSSKILAP